jgi:hypothetical protein
MKMLFAKYLPRSNSNEKLAEEGVDNQETVVIGEKA